MFDYSKLRGRIIEKFGTCRKFASSIGTSEHSVSFKLTGRSMFSQHDIIKWSESLDIGQEDIPAYFFCLTSSKH